MQCVVTGASSGIGRAIAERFAQDGADRVFVHFNSNRSGAEETAERVRKLGSEAELVQADLASQENREQLIEQLWQTTPRIDTFVNNAGVDVLTGAARRWSFAEKLDRLWQVDVFGTIGLSRRIADCLLTQPLGRHPPSVLFIGWDQATEGMEGDAGQMFGPIKAAIMAFSQSLAQTVAPKIRVNCVAPGWIQTAWGETADESWQRRAQQHALMNRWGKPEDVAAAVAYLCSPDADFITGQIFNVNGGRNHHRH